jgi:hypothetical protein
VAISVWAYSPRCCSTQAYCAIWISCPIVSSCLDHSLFGAAARFRILSAK